MKLDAIGIVSRDIKKTLAFYKLLGIELKQYEDSDHYEATTESGLRMMVDSEKLMKEIDPSWTRQKGSSPTVLCFKLDSSKQVDQTASSIENAGFKIHKKPWDAFWGQRYASVLDPDGNQIDLFADL